MSFQQRFQGLRENPETSRAGMIWTAEEDKELMLRVYADVPLDELAKMHRRTVTGVKARVMQNALEMMDKEGLGIEETSQRVHISKDDLMEYKIRRDAKAATQRMNANRPRDDKYMHILEQIRDLLIVIAAKK